MAAILSRGIWVTGAYMRPSASMSEKMKLSELLEMQPYAPHIYLGADDLQEEGIFVWVATGEPVSYTNWALFEPSSLGGRRSTWEEDCVALESHGGWGWNDMCCTCNNRPVVCEY